MAQAVLTLNAGSSTVKYALFERQGLRQLQRGALEGTGEAALGHAVELTRAQGLEVVAVGHRIVHGGTTFSAPALLDAPTLRALQGLVPLAPLHQPHNLMGVQAAQAAFPGAAQVGCFDTAFHRTKGDLEELYALPRRWFAQGVRRFGFHGLSYAYVAQRLAALSPALARGRVVVAHLGSGASLCALVAGRSVATSMGFSTLDGVPMGTRSGALDAGVLLHLLQHHHLSVAQLEQMLYLESGLLGLSGGESADMRALLASPSQEAAEAVEVFVRRCAREVAALATAAGGLQGLVFTAGIGEHAPAIRARIVAQLAWLGITLDEAANAVHAAVISAPGSKVEVRVVPTNEELSIAQGVTALLPG